ncbi:tRNA lysidine(34) synthetase TilS [Enterobacteriaceae bacterium LUAb1]
MLTNDQIAGLQAGSVSLLVAYSGGLDSSVLLHRLVQLRESVPSLTIRAIHVHHGLSADADCWVNHCQQQCQKWQVDLVVERVTLNSRPQGIEAAAREARYAAFATHLQTGERLVTAQHLDDQCETLLLAIKRGSGPAGLAAMPEQRPFAGGCLWRPFLAVSRTVLQKWAQQHQLTWIEDESNQDVRFDRNFLRLQVLPSLLTRWPHFAQASARSAALCAEQEQLLDELLTYPLQNCMQEDGSLLIAPLMVSSKVKRNALLRRWLAGQHERAPAREVLERLWTEVACSREDANPQLRLSCGHVRRYRGALYCVRYQEEVSACQLLWPSPWQPLLLPDGLGTLLQDCAGVPLRMPGDDERVSVRFTAREGRYHIAGRPGGRSLKKLWQEKGIPPWQRQRIPLLFYNEQLVAALGVFVTCEGEVPPEEACWQVYWQRNHHVPDTNK